MSVPDMVAELDHLISGGVVASPATNPRAVPVASLIDMRNEITWLRSKVDHYEQGAAAIRAEALEEAAHECDLRAVRIGWDEASWRACAAVIRRLKEHGA